MTTPEPTAQLQIAAAHQRRLRAREAAALRQMTRLYAELAKDLADRATPLAEEVARRQAAGDAVAPWEVRNVAGYTELTAAVDRDMRQLVQEVTVIIAALQRDGWRLGAQMADAQLRQLVPAELRRRLTGP